MAQRRAIKRKRVVKSVRLQEAEVLGEFEHTKKFLNGLYNLRSELEWAEKAYHKYMDSFFEQKDEALLLSKLSEISEAEIVNLATCKRNALGAFKDVEGLRRVVLAIEKRIFKAAGGASKISQEERWALTLTKNLENMFLNSIEELKIVGVALRQCSAKQVKKTLESKSVDRLIILQESIEEAISALKKAEKNLKFASAATRKLHQIDQVMMRS